MHGTSLWERTGGSLLAGNAVVGIEHTDSHVGQVGLLAPLQFHAPPASNRALHTP